jgi:hypothetical protein
MPSAGEAALFHLRAASWTLSRAIIKAAEIAAE